MSEVSILEGQARRAIACLFALSALLLAPGSAVAAPQVINYDLATTSVLRINLPISQAVTVTISEAVGKIVSADPAIADAQPITDKSLYLVGKGFGTTTVNLYSSSGAPVGLLAVEVGADTSDIARSIKSAIPNSAVKVSTVNGRVRLSGTVPDEVSMQKAMDIVAQYGSPALINTMTLSGGRQVNLEVRILEANRSAGRELGIEWKSSGPGFVGEIGSGPGDPTQGAQSFSAFITGVIANGISVQMAITALEQKGLVRTLAEPNLTTLSGVKASFLAGGQIPLRVQLGDNKYSIEYKDFGVRLVFVPVVLEGDRIQIKLTPEVSGIGGFTDAGDPIFNTRNLDATVELRDGQSFSVAGLLQNETKLTQNQLPWLGDVPVLGSLFRSSSFQKQETELVVIVTPRLVQPATPGQVVATPFDQTVVANDPEFFALGKLEVTSKMIKDFQTGAGIAGPYGYIIDLGNGT
ncbi:MAG: type II and III secretion system protein family protein [Devosia sp.]